MSLEVGTRLGHYDVTAKIGQGVAWAQVWQATDTKLNRQVALQDPARGVCKQILIGWRGSSVKRKSSPA